MSRSASFETRLEKIEARRSAQRVTYKTPRGQTVLHADEAMDAAIALVYLDQDSAQARTLLSASDAGDGSDLHGLLQMLRGADGKLRPLANRRDYSQVDERQERAMAPGEWPRVRLLNG